MYSPFNCDSSTNKYENSSIDNLKNELSAVFEGKLRTDGASFHLINGRLYQKNLIILEADILFNIARKQWKQAEETALAETTVHNVNVCEIRKQIVNLLSLCRYSIQECPAGSQKTLLQNKLLRYLKLLKNTITPWRKLEEKSLKKLASSSVTDCNIAIYHYFHMYLDVQWLILVLYYLCEASPEHFDVLLEDLLILSYSWYKKYNETEIAQQSAFICPCVKKIWVLLQIFNEKLHKMGIATKCFWETFNSTLKDCSDMFSLWVLHSISMLQGYSEDGEYIGPTNSRVCENHSLMEIKLKSLNTNCIASSDNNITLLNCCKVLDPLLSKWWMKNVKSEHYQILWEIFNKHINLSLGINNMNSSAELVELVQQILKHSQFNNSYEYFLHMLNKYLTKFPNQWPRVRGRIYCKLPPHKINELSNSGVYNITLLFLTLACTINITEMTEKLSSLLSNLTCDRQNSPLIWNIYIGLVVLHVQQGYPAKEVSTPILQLIQSASNDRKLFYLIRLYITGFDTVLNASQNFNLQQHVMINGWVSKYLTHCEYNDLCHFLNVLLYSIKHIRTSEAWTEWEDVLKQHVLPALKMKSVAMFSNSPSQVGELAALIDPNPASDWVFTFTADLIAPNVTCHFILTLLEDISENCMLPKNHETAILHAWIRCCLLNCENSQRLTQNVMKIRALCAVFEVKPELTDKPLISFIISLSKLSSKVMNLQELCEQCFGRLDSWVVPFLKDPVSESQLVHLYTCIAVLIYHCSSLLYHKNRTNCLLNRLINIFLLPPNILIGNSPHKYMLNAIQQTWHRFVEGIFSLDCSHDAYLERTLRDMVIRYFPLLPVPGSVMLKCLENEKLATLILEKISAAFLSHSSRSSDAHTIKALKFVQLALENATSTETKKLILHSTFTSILEVIMFNIDKSTAINIVTTLAHSKEEELKECVQFSVSALTEKHLAFSANNYFQCVTTVAKLMPAEVRSVLPIIKKKLVDVERMRGVGYDNTLRQCFDRLEMFLG